MAPLLLQIPIFYFCFHSVSLRVNGGWTTLSVIVQSSISTTAAAVPSTGLSPEVLAPFVSNAELMAFLEHLTASQCQSCLRFCMLLVCAQLSIPKLGEEGADCTAAFLRDEKSVRGRGFAGDSVNTKTCGEWVQVGKGERLTNSKFMTPILIRQPLSLALRG